MSMHKPYILLDKEKMVIISLLLFAFIFRLFGALQVPYVFDELTKEKVALGISFHISDLRVPIGDQRISLPLLNTYLMKIGYDLFGRSILGGRILIVILATIGLYFIYILAKNGLTKEKAFYALFLSTFSQFHIGWSRINEEDSLLLFFVPFVLYAFYRAITNDQRKMLVLASIFMGIGALAKPTILLLVPPLFLFCAITKEYRKFVWDANNYIIIIGIPLIILMPYIYWNISHGLCDFKFYLEEIHSFGLSLVPITLFLGEAIVYYCAYWLKDSVIEYLTSPEYPFMHWPLGIICLIGSLYAFNSKKSFFFRFLLTNFFIIFIALFLVKPHGYIHLDEFWWASPLFVPSIIFAAHLLVDLKNSSKGFSLAVIAFLLYLVFHAVNFVKLPENCFVPRKGIITRHLYGRANFYLSEGKRDKAKELYRLILKMDPNEAMERQVKEIILELPFE